jgi:hypothetical protein
MAAEPRDDDLSMARGVVVGMLVGLGFWATVLIVCAVIA